MNSKAPPSWSMRGPDVVLGTDTEVLELVAERAPLVADRLDLLPGEARGRVGAPDDPEPAFGAAVHEVRRGAEIGGEFGVVAHGVERRRRAPVAVAADQRVDRRILAEAA